MGHKKWLCVLALPLIIILLVAGTSASLSQDSFTLDLDMPLFNYTEDRFNDTNQSSEYDYNQSGNVTYWISLPKNSVMDAASLLMEGKITYIYTSGIGGGVRGLSVGDVIYGPGNEIVRGTETSNGLVRILHGNNGTIAWSYYIGAYHIYSTAVGNVTSNPGNEIAVGSENGYVYVLDCSDTGATEAWNYSTGATDVVSVAIGNLDSDENEVIAGSDKVYALNSTGGLLWNYTIGSIKSIAVGNITSHQGNETVVGASSGIHVLNSTGGLIWTKNIGTTVLSVSIGNVNPDQGNEIAAGGSDDNIYLLTANETGGEINWTYPTDDDVNSVIIGDVLNSAENEVVAGSVDGKIYTLNQNGSLIWSYDTDKNVRGVAIGNVTGDNGNEVIAGDVPSTGTVYVFNFDYFPTNVSIDVGADGDWDWSYIEKLRGNRSVNGTGFTNGFQEYLDSCTPVNGSCDVPIMFHSDWAGKLNVSGLNISYQYNLSGLVQYQIVNRWSRISNIRVNESVGNVTKNITFTGSPVNDVLITYMAIDGSANKSDFNMTTCNVTDAEGRRVCNLSDFTFSSTGPLPGPFLLWDDSMESGKPVLMNESLPASTTGTDNYYSVKNLTIWNTTNQTFYLVIGNVTLNDTIVHGGAYLRVFWEGGWCNLTPNSTDPDCNTDTPNWTETVCGSGTFRSCSQDTNTNGITEFFKWKQPQTSTTSYQAGGETNVAPLVENSSVTPAQAAWNSSFNFTIDVNDYEGDNVSVTLFISANQSGWFEAGTKNMTGSGTVWFNVSSTRYWTGTNSYLFSYHDFNASNSSQVFHSARNTTQQPGPTGLKHNTSVLHAEGNESAVVRENSTLLVVRVNDTTLGEWAGAGINCTFWVTTDFGNFTTYSNQSNGTGHCILAFSPNQTYMLGNQTWKAGVEGDGYYNNSNSSQFIVQVKGRLNINLTCPAGGQRVYRNASQTFSAKLTDGYGTPVSDSTLNTSGYNCSFYFNNTVIGTAPVNMSGGCNLSWTPNCTYKELGPYDVNVSLVGPEPVNYTIKANMSSNQILLFDYLNIAILSPPVSTLFYKGWDIDLNSSTNDTCLLCSEYSVAWWLEWKKTFRVNLTEASGINRTDEPVILNGSQLQAAGINLSEWKINWTRVLCNGTEVESRVLAWTNESKEELNETQVFMGQHSELMFLVNMSSWGSRNYTIAYNRTTPAQWNISYLLNGGFESGQLSPWECVQAHCSPSGCNCSVSNLSGTNGNYSAYLVADEDMQNNNVVGVNQNLSLPLSTNSIRIRYKAWGEYSDGAWLRVQANGASCDLNTGSGVAYGDASWTEQVCTDPLFYSAESINITLHDVGDGGNPVDHSYALIDFVCPADSNGNCTSMHSGAPLGEGIDCRSNIGTSDNTTWNIPVNDNVGRRTIHSTANGTYYEDGTDNTSVYFWGWSKLSQIGISSDDCIYNGTWACRRNATITIICRTLDKNSSSGIWNYNESFFGDWSPLGNNFTNTSGWGSWTWVNSTDVVGIHNISCNITDWDFYNDTPENDLNITFNVSTGNTTGVVLLDPTFRTAANITKDDDYSFDLQIVLVNNGSKSMYSPELNIQLPAGMSFTDVNCPPIEPGGNCTVNTTITATIFADLGNSTPAVTAEWYNDDGTTGNATNTTTVFVENNTILNIVDNILNVTVQRANYVAINFTVESFGNTNLTGITFNESGENASQVSGWINYTPTGIPNIGKLENQSVLINISVPNEESEGIYLLNITANSTGTSCSPDQECWDSVLLAVNVTIPDWEREEETLEKKIGINSENGTIGSVSVWNNRQTDYTLNVTVSGNGTQYITIDKSLFIMGSGAADNITVYHNRTGGMYGAGVWAVNITIANLNSTVPPQLITQVMLDVLNVSIDIMSPNQTNPIGPLNASDIINMTIKATKGVDPIAENMSWVVLVGGITCADLDYGFNATSGFWNLNCSAPDITGNPINNTLKVTGTYTTESIVVVDEEGDAVVYDDVTPPQMSGVDVEPVSQPANKDNVTFIVNITDNTAIDTVWATVVSPAGETAITDYIAVNNTFTFNYSNPNLVGDYDITVYANDTYNQTNSAAGWFDVYVTTQFGFNSTDPKGIPQLINITLYRNSTGWIVHNLSTNLTAGDYNWTIHKRKYDILADITGHSVRFLEADFNTTNINNSFRLDLFRNNTAEDIGNINLPKTGEKKILALVVDNPNLTHSSKLITLDYTQAWNEYQGELPDEDDLRLFICSDWNYTTRVCSTDELTHLDENIVPNITQNKFSFTASGSTVYVIAKSCYPNTCGETPPNPPGDTNTYSPGGGTTPSEDDTVCGNGVCETGENELNCPEDCLLAFPFTIETGITDMLMNIGTNKTYPFYITNLISTPIGISIATSGKIEEFITFDETEFTLGMNETKNVRVLAKVPETTLPGTYTGTVSVTSGGKTQEIPVTLKVTLSGMSDVSMVVDLITKRLPPRGTLRFNVRMRNIGFRPVLNITLTYFVKDSTTEETLYSENETITLRDIKTLAKTLSLSEVDTPLGEYFLEVRAGFDSKSVEDIETFEIVLPFWSTLIGQLAIGSGLLVAAVGAGLYGRKKYLIWKLEKARYVFPVDYKKLPQKDGDAFWAGKIADTTKDTWLNPDDLMTHVLVAGATGSGKSVGASVIVEEALDRKIPVVAFDPTAQWTGFVKPCKDENLLKHYPRFGMNRKNAHPYKGMIFEVTDPKMNIDFKRYINPGEITVFTLNKLKPGEYDLAVKSIIDSIFNITWEESTSLKLIIVFDEVHRLLEKYGGSGGYVALERAAREFRKWGIGMIMCSQVLADFKEAIEGNVLTDIQLNTKSITDIRKVQEKHGENYARKITRQAVGVGMAHHPKYNDGKPYFINFRPTWHNPHKITEDEMNTYKMFAAKIKVIEDKIAEMKKSNIDTLDIELELKLGSDKLKLGRFRMAEIYITALEERLKIKKDKKEE